MVCFSTLIGCFIWIQSTTFWIQSATFWIQSATFYIHSSHHSQLIWTRVAAFTGRHSFSYKVGMHHQHVVTGLWSCSISVAQRDRKVGEDEGGQEEYTEGHLVFSMSIQLCMCIYIDTSNDTSIMWNMSAWLYNRKINEFKYWQPKFKYRQTVLVHIIKALNWPATQS